MGAVYLVRDIHAGGREVALKVQVAEDAGLLNLRRFEREATIMASLSHPGVVKIHKVGEVPQGPFVLMEYVEGEPLDSLDLPLECREAARIARGVAEALAALHERGIIHRDLKPSNVIRRTDGRPVLLDFGLARHVREDRMTRTGEVVGSACYMAPEQADGANPDQLGPPVDVYGLGVLLFELLTGRAPYVGSPIEVMIGILEAPPPRPSSLRREVPPGLDAIVRKATRPAPEDRYTDALSLAEDLDRYLSGDPPLALNTPSRVPAVAWASATLLTILCLGGWLASRGLGETPVAPPSLSLLEVEAQGGRVVVRGTVRSEAAWAEVSLQGVRQRVEPSAPFELSVPVDPGALSSLVEVTGPAGAGQSQSISLRGAWPDWFVGLPDEARPPLPLPEGLVPDPDRPRYLWERDGSEFVWVPPGEFTMGRSPKTLFKTGSLSSGLDERGGAARVRVRLTRGVFMGVYEVTWKQWDRFCRATGRALSNRIYAERFMRNDAVGLTAIAVEPWTAGDDHPASAVTWGEARAYCRWAGLRLPTDAEWERAARGDTMSVYPWGDEFDPTACNANLNDGSLFTSPVGTFRRDRSPYGCFDMVGNVSEMVADRYHPLAHEPQLDPTGPSEGEDGVVRGGCWVYSVPQLLTISGREKRMLTLPTQRMGFRVALSSRP
jgi:eukaryotic-like serine/threonine-protein kinase